MKIICGCLVMMKRAKCDGLYCLMGHMLIIVISLNLMGSWKQGAWSSKHLCRVSFIVGVKTNLTSFPLTNNGDTFPVVGEDALRSLFRVDWMCQFRVATHVHWCIMIELRVMIGLI